MNAQQLAYARYARDCDQRDRHFGVCPVCREAWYTGVKRTEVCPMYRQLSANVTDSMEAYIATN